LEVNGAPGRIGTPAPGLRGPVLLRTLCWMLFRILFQVLC